MGNVSEIVDQLKNCSTDELDQIVLYLEMEYFDVSPPREVRREVYPFFPSLF